VVSSSSPLSSVSSLPSVVPSLRPGLNSSSLVSFSESAWA
jgi:hypothetical protein